MYNQIPQPGPTPTMWDPSPQDQGLSPGVEHSTLPQGNLSLLSVYVSVKCVSIKNLCLFLVYLS